MGGPVTAKGTGGQSPPSLPVTLESAPPVPAPSLVDTARFVPLATPALQLCVDGVDASRPRPNLTLSPWAASVAPAAPLAAPAPARITLPFSLSLETRSADQQARAFSGLLSGPFASLRAFDFSSTPVPTAGFTAGLSFGVFDGRMGLGVMAGIQGLGSGILTLKFGPNVDTTRAR